MSMKEKKPEKAFSRKKRLPYRGISGVRFSGHLIKAAALGALLLAASTSWATVAGTKHNFGKLSTADIKSADSSEICVFCHTPHNSNPSGPVWNRQDTGSTYDVYASQTLAATLSPNAPVLGQPTGSSKLCLSCHDGTMAIGSLLNMPGKGLGGTLNVTGPGVTSGKLTSASTSYIGTDLRDDHPISFEYVLSSPSNPEMVVATSIPPQVKLDSLGKVQCTSCHDPHGTAFPKFMVESLENGALCTACHDKRYWSTMPSIHSTSTAVWNGAGENPWNEDMGAAGFTDDTVAMQSCLACHKSHSGVAGKPLLKGTDPGSGLVVDEEWTCLNCHNGNVASKDIDATLSNFYKHDPKATAGLHVASRDIAGNPSRETAANLGTFRHAECSDCHNPHGAKSGNHSIGGVTGNIIGANGLGGWGVRPNPWPSAGSAATSYLTVDFTSLTPGADNLEGYLCIKCHSYYAYGINPPNVPSGNADGSLVLESDATKDFNINNASFHPVFAQGQNQPPVTANPNWPINSLGLTNTFRYVDFPGTGVRDGWYKVQHTSTMTCTDCHGPDSAAAPQGPHGSSEKWILRKNETGFGTLKNFCYNCHRRNVYGDEGYVGPNANYSRVSHPVDGLGAASPFYAPGTNTGNNGNKFGILCLTCHGGGYDTVNNVMKGIHGSNAGAGSQPGSDALGYRMMNGACVESYVRPTTTTNTQMFFRTITISSDPVCNNNFADFTNGNTANYNCSTVSSCAN
ncbi:MAG: cytochrome c3 family protein [Thermodesulfobacteriota bacterium]